MDNDYEDEDFDEDLDDLSQMKTLTARMKILAMKKLNSPVLLMGSLMQNMIHHYMAGMGPRLI